MSEEDDWLKEFEAEEEEPTEEPTEEPEEEVEEPAKEEPDEVESIFEEEEVEEEEEPEEFTCDECGETFDSEKGLSIHQTKAHKKEKPKKKVKKPKKVEAELIFTIYGKKGVGKTTQALSFPGKIEALSFDRKTAIIKENIYDGDERINIHDMMETLDYSGSDEMLDSAEETFLKTLKILEDMDNSTDWVLIDCLPEVIKMAEFTMRRRNDLGPFDGIKNLNIWKERKMFIRQIHKLAYEAARKGVIYTTDSEKDEIVEQGELVTKDDVPKWIKIIMRETDFVLQTEFNKTSGKHLVRVITSKDDDLLRTGEVIDVSDFGKVGEMMFTKGGEK